MIDIIITSYGEINATEKAIRAILDQNLKEDFRIIVSDPFSETKWMIEEKFPNDSRILFVEDEDAVRGVAAKLLRARGYEVIEAAYIAVAELFGVMSWECRRNPIGVSGAEMPTAADPYRVEYSALHTVEVPRGSGRRWLLGLGHPTTGSFRYGYDISAWPLPDFTEVHRDGRAEWDAVRRVLSAYPNYHAVIIRVELDDFHVDAVGPHPRSTSFTVQNMHNNMPNVLQGQVYDLRHRDRDIGGSQLVNYGPWRYRPAAIGVLTALIVRTLEEVMPCNR